MASGMEEVRIGPVESEPSDYALRSVILPKELDAALADFSQHNGVLSSVLLGRLAREYLEVQGVEFSAELEGVMAQQEQFERAREVLRNPGQAAVFASGMDGDSLDRIQAAFDPSVASGDLGGGMDNG